jgi:hypothetical protein
MPQATEKARYFDFILYLDSSPDNRVELLETLGVPMAISPLHDKDVSDREGQKYKKAHYHVIYIAKNPVTARSVRNKVNRVLGEHAVSVLEITLNIADMFAYLTHESKDAIKKHKYLYDKKDLVLLNNFDIDRYITLAVEEKDDIFNEFIKIIFDNGLANINELRRFVVQRGSEYGISLQNMNKVLRDHTGLVRLYFDASYQERKYGKREIDFETGEVLRE